MRDLSTLTHFAPAEQLVDVLMHKTQTPEPLFFRVLVAYYFTKVASMMRCNIKSHDRGIIPVNMYAINLSPSGSGKGFSTNIIEDHVINQFRTIFLDSSLELISEDSLSRLAMERCTKKNTVYDTERLLVQKEYENLGSFPFSFDSGTPAAVKQVRHKALMSGAGSLNFEMDEIGSNLLGNIEVLTTYLELYDVGKVKPKLTKNTADNKRNEDINGRTPTNMMLFGTPINLLDGGKVEEEFDDMQATGYARRCFFGYIDKAHKNATLSAIQVYDALTSTKDSTFLNDLSDKLGNLADMINFKKELTMTKDISIELIEYKLHCESIAATYGDHEETRKAELSHRYFKALKLAGTYAFIDGSDEITADLLYNAIKLVEESGVAFGKVLSRERNYIKLAKYISSIDREVSHVDLVEDLPCYKGSSAAKQEMLTLAIAYGYKNNIIIKKHFTDGIEFLSGESLKETNIIKMPIAYSQQMSDNYLNDYVAFSDLAKLTQLAGYHWINHHVFVGHRREKSILPGFSLLVLDVDGGTPISTVELLMKEYTYHIYTTKSHTNKDNRFRIVLAMNYELSFDKSDYTQFMNNIYDWLPFTVDTSTKDRCRKWLSHQARAIYHPGVMFDVLPFIPKTQKNEDRQKLSTDQSSLNRLEAWFLNNTGNGNRSNQLIKYGYLLVDMGLSDFEINTKIEDLNKKLPDRLTMDELQKTIFYSVGKAVAKRDYS